MIFSATRGSLFQHRGRKEEMVGPADSVTQSKPLPRIVSVPCGCGSHRGSQRSHGQCKLLSYVVALDRHLICEQTKENALKALAFALRKIFDTYTLNVYVCANVCMYSVCAMCVHACLFEDCIVLAHPSQGACTMGVLYIDRYTCTCTCVDL